MSNDDQDYEFLLEEVTEKYFVKCSAIGEFFGFLESLPPGIIKRLLDTFENATGPQYLADIAEDLRWLIDGDGRPKERRNLFRLVPKDVNTTEQ
jgi:hypothetical protein